MEQNDPIQRLTSSIEEAAWCALEEAKAEANPRFTRKTAPRFRRKTIKVCIDREKYPDLPDTIWAFVYRGLAIHPSLNCPETEEIFYISHVASGKCLSNRWMCLPDARVCVWRLAKLLDWTQDEATVSRTLRENPDIREKVHKLLENAHAILL